MVFDIVNEEPGAVNAEPRPASYRKYGWAPRGTEFTVMAKEPPMSEDEKAIRTLVETWMTASQAGDARTVLSLMTKDVIFMVPGREPFGREVFEAAAEGGPRMEGTNELAEVQVLGDIAFSRNRIELTVTMPTGEKVRRGGYTLTLYRKEADGRWRLFRDANLLTVRT